MILRNWLLDFALNIDKYPKAWALYLFYSDTSENFIWPLANGVCGNTYRSPRADQEGKADWCSVLSLDHVYRSFARDDPRTDDPPCSAPPDIEGTFMSESLIRRGDVFGANVGRDTKTPDGAI
jgi:hypothetical protein